LKALEVVADLIKEEDCKRLIDSTISKFGKLDILVKNTGAGVVTPIKDPSIMDSYERFMKLCRNKALLEFRLKNHRMLDFVGYNNLS
jgi:NAD(P)-dependent dehydrogenase (short-subunit alcohol dehydrogenase family)